MRQHDKEKCPLTVAVKGRYDALFERNNQFRVQQQQADEKLSQKMKDIASLEERIQASQQQSLKKEQALQEQLNKASKEIAQLKAAKPQPQ